MSEAIDKLVQALLKGKKKAHDALVAALSEVEPDEIIKLLGHDEPVVRFAALRACRKRTDAAGLLRASMALAQDDDEAVRRAVLGILEAARKADPEREREAVEAALRTLLSDSDSGLRRLAAKRSAGRASLVEQLGERLRHDSDWEVREELAKALAKTEGEQVALTIEPLLHAVAKDSDRDVLGAASRALEGFFESERFPEDHRIADPVPLLAAVKRMRQLGMSPRTLAWMESATSGVPDTAALARFGIDLAVEAGAGRLPETFVEASALDGVLEVLRGGSARAVVLHGPSGTGKTALVHALAQRFAAEGDSERWSLVRVSPTDLLAGTAYVGEWQTRVQQLIDAVAAPRRAVLYIPNLDELAYAGQSSSSDSSAASMLAPHVESGRVAIIGETTPEGWSQGLGRHPSFSRLFTRVPCPPASPERTRELLELVALGAGKELESGLVDRLVELADAYHRSVELPGRAIGMLRRLAEADGQLDQLALMRLVNTSTGIPREFLDDTAPLDLTAVREFLAARVMGQADATEAVLDLVTLMKAGLTDPSKPCGVFLFVGPTGVGKTELARALAELLFGDPQRLVRLDMSEYATHDAFERLIGTRGSPGKLTNAVADHPFSVVLLDEIEKGHLNVYDLMLQVFDAGRLTDGRGRTVNFTNSVVILTSNVGSAMPTEKPVGFGDAPAAAPDRSAVQRDLHRYFRPEFLNRIDRVVHFRPLGLETADRIARREVADVLRRGGIERRGLSVDVDDPVFALLLRQGYSPALGARPLKRTVERLVLLPIARAIAEGQVARGDVLRLVVKGREVRVEVVSGETRAGVAEEAKVASIEALLEGHSQLAAKIEGVTSRRDELVQASAAPDFWDQRERAIGALDELHRVDRLLDDYRRLGGELEITRDNPDRKKALRFAEFQARELDRIGFLLGVDDHSDALLSIAAVRVERGGLGAFGGLDGTARLARMYAGLFGRMKLEHTVLDDRYVRSGEGAVTLSVVGLGAFALLRAERGTHLLVESRDGRDARELLRVDVLRVPSSAPGFDPSELAYEAGSIRGQAGPFGTTPELQTQLLHKPTGTSIHAWTTGSKAEALERLGPWLRALVERAGAGQSAPRDELPQVRRYSFGAAPMVRDARTGRTTGRIDRVMRGELSFLF